jgi:hypothetical protein
MSDPRPQDDDADARIFRAALPGWQSGLSRPKSDRAAVLFAPGRGYLELSIALSAVAIIIPLCAVGAFVASRFARRAGNDRWRAAMIASVWCAFLGVVLRAALGLGVLP